MFCFSLVILCITLTNSSPALAANPDIITPFLISCSSRNAKYCASGIQCLHILITSRSIAISSLPSVIDALTEATHLGVEIQLKILQTLPSLLQFYGSYLHDSSIVDFLQICSILQAGNKNSIVVNTAAATLQQLLIAIFDRVVTEDSTMKNLDEDELFTVPIDGDGTVKVGPSNHDALLIFTDLCSLTEKQKPVFLKFPYLIESFGLELLESILTNHSSMFIKHEELGFVLRTRAVPLLLRAFSEKREFSITVRVTRILYLLVRKDLPALEIECEVILSLLTHMISPDAAPYWKRVLCMEVFQGLLSDFQLIVQLFEKYDDQPSRRPIVLGMVEQFNKISRENPEIIGTSTYSVPFRHTPDGANTDDSNEFSNSLPLDTVGLSVHSSTMRVPCIDLLDKADPPLFPISYIYYLDLACINSFSEGLVKSVISLSHASGDKDTEHLSSNKSNGKSSTGKKVQKVIPKSQEADLMTKLTQSIWKPILQAFDVFFSSCIDLELYHSLVRAAQRFAHTAGILELDSPRDSFMLLLAKYSLALPPDPAPGNSRSQGTSLLSVEGIVGSLGSSLHQRQNSSVGATFSNPGQPKVSVVDNRNVLCLRALFNIAVALGNSLNGTWSLIFEVLQCFDTIVYGKKQRSFLSGEGPGFGKARPDLTLVDSSVKKLLEHSKELDHKAFHSLFVNLCGVSVEVIQVGGGNYDIKLHNVGNLANSNPVFLLCILGELLMLNIQQFSTSDSDSWSLVASFLLRIVGTKVLAADIRSTSGHILNKAAILIAVECADLQKTSEKSIEAAKVQRDTIEAILNEIRKVKSNSSPASSATDMEIHAASVESLREILEQCGSRMAKSWDIVFDILATVFVDNSQEAGRSSSKLIKSGFESLQLICNDFMDCLPENCLIRVIESLYQFCEQKQDLNISFTSISLFWNVADHLKQGLKQASVPDIKRSINNVEELDSNLNGVFDDNSRWALWILVLVRVADISGDERTQVRNGAVQILFRIFETSGSDLPVNIWKTCHSIALSKVMITPPELSKEYVETTGLVLEGVSTVYSWFLQFFIDHLENFEELLSSLIEWWKVLTKLEDPVISQSVYCATYTILSYVKENNVSLPSEALEKFWIFWKNQKLPETVIDAKAASESATRLVSIFEPLYDISKPGVSDTDMTGAFNLLESCASFALTPPFQSDSKRMTPLQEAAFARITSISLTSSHATSLFCKSVSDISTLCLMDKKSVCSGTSSKTPTFISLSYSSLDFLDKSIGKLTNANDVFLKIYEDKTIEKVMSNMVVILKRKFFCPIVPTFDGRLWQLATNVFLCIVRRIVANELPPSDKIQQQLLEGGRCILSFYGLSALPDFTVEDDLKKYEEFDIASYDQFIDLIHPSKYGLSLSASFWQQLIRNIAITSLLYEKAPNFVLDKICSVDFEKNLEQLIQGPRYGSTTRVKLLPRGDLAYHCFDELFRLSSSENNEVSKIASVALAWRSALVIDGYVANRPLYGKRPLSQIEKRELTYLFNQLLLLEREKANSKIHILFPLIASALPVAQGDRDTLLLLQELLLKI